MSTLCAYENYLRDRYVLGQSVHYAAGSSSPKPKSYDREGNEYTWSDEAGDYVRQVGGPGGGRTIRLSEVEKAEIKQPQNRQANADSGQNGPKKEAAPQSNVDYSEFADAYKRYRAEDKKVASLKRKASKIQKAVFAPSSGATPEEIQSARESLAKIRGEISASEKAKESLSSGLNLFTLKHRVVFVDSGNTFVINPSLELLDVLKQRKRLQDRFKKARKNAKEAKKAGSKVGVDNFTSVADILEAEIGRVNEQLSQMFPNETVVSVVDEKPKRRPANKKKKLEESDAQFDASGLGLPGKSDVALEPDVTKNKDSAYFVRRDLEATPKSETEERVEEIDEVSETPSSEAPQRDDDATLERKVKEALGKSEPLRKKATRLRSKAKDAALKGRKEEAAGLRKQADEIEAEARKYIDEATNAGVELKNRRAEASQQPVPETKDPMEKPEVPNSSAPEQQPESIAEPAQEPPAKPRPERWTPLKSKMNDDDRRVIESTRKRLNFGLADFAWRIANAKEKKDWKKVKELTVLASQRYLEQARRAYRSHGGAEALAAFDESLSGEGLTVGQVRDRVVDKFRQLALMNVADLHKYAGERLDEWEAFSQGAELPSTKNKIALNRLLDKPHYAPNAVPYTPPEKGKIYEVPIDSLNLDPSRFQFKLNTNARGVTDDLEGAEFDPMQAGIIHVWRDPDDGKDYVVNGHHRFNLAKNSGHNGKVNVRYIDADTADDAKAFGAVANIADSKGTATDVAEFIRTRGSNDIRTPAGKKIATKNKLLADGRVLSKLDDTIFRKLKNGSIDEKTARIIAAELPDDKEKQLRLFSDIERLGLDASQAQDRAWAYASIQGEKQQGSLFGDDAPMEYDVESRSKLIGEIRKALGGAKRAAQAGGSSRNNEYWESQKLATNFDRDRAKQLSKSAGQTLDFFKDHIRLTGPMQNIIKEEHDEYRKAIKAGKGAEKVVERAIERIKDVAQGGDGSVRRVEGLGLEYEDRLPSAKSEQTRQGVEANGRGEKQKPPRTPSESLRSGTAGEVFEAGGTDRPSDGGDGRNLASVIAEEAQKSDIPKNRVREELDAPRQSKTSLGSRKAVQSLRNLIQRVYDHDGLSERIKSRAANVFGDTLSAPGETGFEPIGEHDKYLFELVNKLDKAKKRLEEIQERFDENPDSEKLERAVDKAEDVANGIEDRLIKAVDKFIQPYSGKPKSKRPAPVAKKQPLLSTRTPQKEDKTDWEKDLELQEELKPVSKGKFNPDVEPYSYTPERNAFSSAGSVTPRYHRDKEIANTIQKWIDEQRKTGRSTDIVPYKEIFYPGESHNKPGHPAKQPAGTNAKVVEEIEAFDRVRSPEASSLHEKKKTADGFKKASSKKKRGEL